MFTNNMSSILETNVSYHNHHHHHHHKRRAKTPSFSSILLDAIYRSIDEEHHHHHHHGEISTSPTHGIIKQKNVETEVSEFVQRRTKMRSDGALETVDLRRAIMIESWMEKQPHQQPPHSQSQRKHHFHLGEVSDQKVKILRQKSVPSRVQEPYNNSSLSSSSCFTNLASRSSRDQSSSRIFTKTKSRAMKIYGELKKPKSQNSPVSPGRRIATFLNSIFRNTSNSPATRRNHPPPSTQMAVDTRMTTSNTTCSTGSSFSKLCLSHKTTSSSTKSTPANTTKRPVKFYHKSLHNNNESERSKKLVSPRHVNGGNLEQQKWRREKDMDALIMMIKSNCGENMRFNEEDIDEDERSCASSDLFELENFSSIRYYEELPVYGTTSFKNVMG